jgi:hypothetical protein
MGGVIVLLAGLLIIWIFINPILKFFGKKAIHINYSIPFGLFLAMCFIAYELKFPFLSTVIIFGFGLMVGAIIENIYHEIKKEEDAAKPYH